MGSPEQADIIRAEQAKTLTGLLLERVRRSPDAVAYGRFDPSAQRWMDLTWIRVAENVGRWQAAQACEGLNPGDRVALQKRSSPEWVFLDMAALGMVS
jgi:long-chain acyl-CoA synthetase